jgi:ubiquinone/menaquinone biosynthesis C-methylase UbiE
MDVQAHWSGVYRTKAPNDVSWYQEQASLSLDLISWTGAGSEARMIDVGAGASTLVDGLLDAGYRAITLLDLSAQALEIARRRLGGRAGGVTFVLGDATDMPFRSHAFDVWHDRAVFHFLIDPADRQRYVETARRMLTPGGHLIVATFAPDGPTQCSGLPVARYDEASLYAAFGEGFEPVASERETHRTPWGSEQNFVYCSLRTTIA